MENTNGPVRVLHMIGNLDIGGSQALVMSIYRMIDRSRVQFDFVIDRADRNYFVSEIESLGGRVFVLPQYKGYNVGEIKKAWSTFLSEHREYKILHSHVRSYASLYLPVAKKLGLVTIVHSHSTSNGKGVGAIVKRILQYPIRFQADYMLGCSKEAGEWLFGKRAVRGEKYRLVKNAIDSEAYVCSADVREEYREMLMLSGKRVYTHVGRLHEAKNHIFLLDVFSKIKAAQSEAVLLLVGDGEKRRDIENRINELSLSDSVKLLGNRSDIPNILMASDCFLFPSLWEGLGIAAIEAQAASLPCLCSDTLPREVKLTELCEFLPIASPSLDSQIWADRAICANAERKDRRKEIADAGFDIRATAEDMIRFYTDIQTEK